MEELKREFEAMRTNQREMEEKQREMEEKQREMEEKQREMEEKQREMEEKQREMEEKQRDFDRLLSESEKAKKKAQEDVENLVREMETLRNKQKEMEKKQNGFDQTLAKEKLQEEKTLEMRNEEVIKKAKQPLEFDESSGHILFRMANSKAFSEGHGPLGTVLSPVESFSGFAWQIEIKHRKNYIVVALKCDADSNDIEWLCHVSCQFISNVTANNVLLARGWTVADVYTDITKRGWPQAVKTEWLMDPENGFYDVEADTITIKAEVIVRKPIEMPAFFQLMNAVHHGLMTPKTKGVDGCYMLFRMDHFNAFSRGCLSEDSEFGPVERINGLPFRIGLDYRKENIGVFLHYNAETESDIGFVCVAVFQFNVLSCMEGTDEINEGDGILDRGIFSANLAFSSSSFFSIKELMDPKNGFYNPGEDSVTFRAEVFVEKIDKIDLVNFAKIAKKLEKRHNKKFGSNPVE